MGVGAEKRQCLSPAFFFGALGSCSNSPKTGSKSLSATRMLPFPEGVYTSAHRCKHGAFWTGVLSLPLIRAARSQTSPGRVSERRTLPLWGLGRGCSQRTQRAFGTAMRLCASLSRGVAAPLGCVIFSVSVEIAACMPCAQGLSVCARRGMVSLPSARFTCC